MTRARFVASAVLLLGACAAAPRDVAPVADGRAVRVIRMVAHTPDTAALRALAARERFPALETVLAAAAQAGWTVRETRDIARLDSLPVCGPQAGDAVCRTVVTNGSARPWLPAADKDAPLTVTTEDGWAVLVVPARPGGADAGLAGDVLVIAAATAP